MIYSPSNFFLPLQNATLGNPFASLQLLVNGIKCNILLSRILAKGGEALDLNYL